MHEGNGKTVENCTSVDWNTWSLTVTKTIAPERIQKLKITNSLEVQKLWKLDSLSHRLLFACATDYTVEIA